MELIHQCSMGGLCHGSLSDGHIQLVDFKGFLQKIWYSVREADQILILVTAGYIMIGIRLSEFDCGYMVVYAAWSMKHHLVTACYYPTVHESLFYRPFISELVMCYMTCYLSEFKKHVKFPCSEGCHPLTEVSLRNLPLWLYCYLVFYSTSWCNTVTYNRIWWCSKITALHL